MKLAPLALVAACLLSIAACRTTPTAAQLAEDIGPPPTVEQAKTALQSYLEGSLIDPSSAQVRWGESVERGWYSIIFKGIDVGWSFGAQVNAKNRLGGFTGFKPWVVWFKHGNVTALSSPSTSGASILTERVNPVPFDSVGKHTPKTEPLLPTK